MSTQHHTPHVLPWHQHAARTVFWAIAGSVVVLGPTVVAGSILGAL